MAKLGNMYVVKKLQHQAWILVSLTLIMRERLLNKLEKEVRILRKEIVGWLDVRWEDTTVYPTKEKMEHGNPYEVSKLTEQLEDFHEKKVRITIEVIE
jgi:hypothetical protein